MFKSIGKFFKKMFNQTALKAEENKIETTENVGKQKGTIDNRLGGDNGIQSAYELQMIAKNFNKIKVRRIRNKIAGRSRNINHKKAA